MRVFERMDNNKLVNMLDNFLNSGKGVHKYTIKRTRINKKDLAQTRMIKTKLKKFLNIHTTRRRRMRKNKTRKN